MSELNKKDYIYRYRPASKYALDAFLDDNIYAVTPNILNDSLDCSIRYDHDLLYKQLIKSKRFCDKAGRELTEYPNYEQHKLENYNKLLLDYKESCISNARDIKNKEKVMSYIDKEAMALVHRLRSYFGVVCFSHNPDSLLMWSHYASDSSGLLLGYDFLAFKNSANIALSSRKSQCNDCFKSIYGFHTVQYVDELPDNTLLMYKLIMHGLSKEYDLDKDFLSFLKTKEDAESLLSILITKKKEWEYEDEERLVFDLFNYNFYLDYLEFKRKDYYNIGKFKPRIVVMGDKINHINKAAVSFYCIKNLHVELFSLDRSTLLSNSKLNFEKIDIDSWIKSISD